MPSFFFSFLSLFVFLFHPTFLVIPFFLVFFFTLKLKKNCHFLLLSSFDPFFINLADTFLFFFLLLFHSFRHSFIHFLSFFSFVSFLLDSFTRASTQFLIFILFSLSILPTILPSSFLYPSLTHHLKNPKQPRIYQVHPPTTIIFIFSLFLSFFIPTDTFIVAYQYVLFNCSCNIRNVSSSSSNIYYSCCDSGGGNEGNICTEHLI